ncbi:MAG: EthD family reductase [Saprospiraceae bacterium]|nr:EthD family reductase [Saprospiraceae bacterium]
MRRTTFNLLIFLLFVFGLTGCQQEPPVDEYVPKTGMVKVTIMYTNIEGATFDMDYYKSKHMPQLAEWYGERLQHYSIDQGISGRTPEDAIPYLAIGYLYFNSMEDYQSGFEEHGEKILADIPNYTNIRPTLQISEVVKE